MREVKVELEQKPWRTVPVTLSGSLHKLSYTAQAHQPRDGAAHSGLDLPQQSINQDNLLFTGQYD